MRPPVEGSGVVQPSKIYSMLTGVGFSVWGPAKQLCLRRHWPRRRGCWHERGPLRIEQRDVLIRGPKGLLANKDGNFFVADPTGNQVVNVAEDGTLVEALDARASVVGAVEIALDAKRQGQPCSGG